MLQLGALQSPPYVCFICILMGYSLHERSGGITYLVWLLVAFSQYHNQSIWEFEARWCFLGLYMWRRDGFISGIKYIQFDLKTIFSNSSPVFTTHYSLTKGQPSRPFLVASLNGTFVVFLCKYILYICFHSQPHADIYISIRKLYNRVSILSSDKVND